MVDGGSQDDTVARARAVGFEVVELNKKGRAVQINAGVLRATNPIIWVLHADTKPPIDAISHIQSTMADQKTALAGFRAILAGPDKVRWATSFHNWIKTWYVPLLFRPHLFFRGGRLLFGDHAMFFRRQDFISVGGCDPEVPIMEDAELCIKLVRLGRIRLLNKPVYTSDRRVAEWGSLKANLIYFNVGLRWGLGFRQNLNRHYPDVRELDAIRTL